MAWHLILDKATNERVSESAELPADLPAGLVAIDVGSPPDYGQARWDAVSNQLIPVAPPAVSPALTRSETFLRLDRIDADLALIKKKLLI